MYNLNMHQVSNTNVVMRNFDPEHIDEPIDCGRDLDAGSNQVVEENAHLDDELHFSRCLLGNQAKILNSNSTNTSEHNYTIKKKSKNQKRKLVATGSQ